jgi:hypothetical protein
MLASVCRMAWLASSLAVISAKLDVTGAEKIVAVRNGGLKRLILVCSYLEISLHGRTYYSIGLMNSYLKVCDFLT